MKKDPIDNVGRLLLTGCHIRWDKSNDHLDIICKKWYERYITLLRSVEQVGCGIKYAKYPNTDQEEDYAISFSLVVNPSQSHAKKHS